MAELRGILRHVVVVEKRPRLAGEEIPGCTDGGVVQPKVRFQHRRRFLGELYRSLLVRFRPLDGLVVDGHRTLDAHRCRLEVEVSRLEPVRLTRS